MMSINTTRIALITALTLAPVLLSCGSRGEQTTTTTTTATHTHSQTSTVSQTSTQTATSSGTTTETETTATTITDTGPLPGEVGARRVGYILVDDSALKDKSFPTDEQVSKLTHINISFFTVRDEGDGPVLTHDWDSALASDFLTRVRAQANRYGVKLMASVGGWAYGNPTAEGFCDYVAAAETDSSRATFADQARELLDGFCENDGQPCFDGFDLDVEYIGQTVDYGSDCTDGGGVVIQTPDFERAQDFADLLTALRSRFDLLTIAGPGALYSLKFSWSVMLEISQTVDFINIMAYDYTGVWTQTYSSLDTSQAGCAADTHQCWGCGSELPRAVVDHHSSLHASELAPGNYNFLCDSNEAIEGAMVCDEWGSGTLVWESEAGQQVCINPYVLAASRVVDFYTLGIGVDPSKLVLGVGFYGRAFRNVDANGGGDAPGANHGLRQYFDGMCLNERYCWGEPGIPAGSCDTTAGLVSCDDAPNYYWLTGFTDKNAEPDPRTVSYQQLLAVCPEVADLSGVESMGDSGSIACSSAGWIAYYDQVAEVPWLHHAGDDLVVSFDNPRSIEAKGAWALKNGLGGLMFWQLEQDSADLQLLQSVHQAMGGQ